MITAMSPGALSALIFVAGLNVAANATEVPSVPFVDGRSSGDVERGLKGSRVTECWASNTFEEGTVLTLGKRDDGSWHLRLSNPGWQLSAPRKPAITIQVDFYPQIQTVAEVGSQTVLEIADIGQISLMGSIENGYTLKLLSDGAVQKYDLEGSAKVIERIRNCVAD